jgi:hypothetical protein
MTLIAPKTPRLKLTPTAARETVGGTGTVTFNGLTFKVRILAAKCAYGTARYLVTPVSGHGQTWVANLELDAETLPN